MALSHVLRIAFRAERPRRQYNRGWGVKGLDAHPVICAWTLTIQDVNGRPTNLFFDLTDDESPLTIGLDVQQYSQRSYVKPNSSITFMRPNDRHPRTLPVYIRGDDPLRLRAHVDIVGLMPTSLSFLVTNPSGPQRASTLAKRLHRYTHAPYKEMVEILSRGGHKNAKVKHLCREIIESCPVCARSGPPTPTKKISFTHVCEAFNQEIQADFMFADIRGTKYCILHVVDTGTSYSEATIVSRRSGEIMAHTLETVWLLNHGAPKKFSADSEFTKGRIKRFLHAHHIELSERPVRRHNKTGIVERKHRTVKAILERLQNDNTVAPDSTLLARATFLANIFSGSSILSAFELVRGYSPSLFGVDSNVIPRELVESYKDQEYARALQRLIKSRHPRTLEPERLPPGTPVYYFYKSSKHNEPIEWRSGTVISPEPYFVRISNHKGRTSNVAYEDIRVKPKLKLTEELSFGYVEDFISEADTLQQQPLSIEPNS